MRKTIGIMLVAAILIVSQLPVPGNADSLWSETSDSMFTDIKALYEGDIVTIVVNERTNATHNAQTEIIQEESMESSTGEGLIGKFLEKFGIESSDEYKADGTTEAGSTLSTTISAEVMEVLPNGNLILEARRSMVVNAETQTMVLSGVVRKADVSRDNMILSSKIANLNVRYEGKGPVSNRQRPGVLNKIFNMIF